MPVRPILLLDVMETLVTEPFRAEIPALFGMTPEQLLAALDLDAWLEFEEGRISEPEYVARFFADRRAVDGQTLRSCVRNAYRWLEGMEQLLAELKQAGFQMHALSNYPVWYQLIDESLHLSRFLDWTFVSCLTGVRKPAPEAYLQAANTLGVEPRECLFIDDRRVNVDAARAVGMDAIQRRETPGLRRELAVRGLRDKRP
jgi:HAD superfamily hydrolase (TIGR01509 family)